MKSDSFLPIDDSKLSELVDGELDRDEANAILLEALDDSDARDHLKGLLQLRHALAPWRRQEPRCIRVPVAHEHLSQRFGSRSHAGGYAIAAAIGGLLVMGGFMLANSQGRQAPNRQSIVAVGQQDLSPETVHQVAKVFAFHESVGGPLKWYASDDQEVQLASIDGTRSSGEPVVVFIDLAGDGASKKVRRYMVVCRTGQQAAVDFPAGLDGLPAVRLKMLPSYSSGNIELRYVVDLRRAGDDEDRWVSVAGQNSLGRKPQQLGAVVLHDRSFTVAASGGRLDSNRRDQGS